MAGKFEVYEDSAGSFRFRLKAGNGEILASGRGYASKASAKRACESVLRAAEGAQVVETVFVSGSTDLSASDSGSELVPAPRRKPDASAVPGPQGRSTDEIPAPEQVPVRRRFRFTGGMSAEHDLAARSGEIIRDEFGRD